MYDYLQHIIDSKLQDKESGLYPRVYVQYNFTVLKKMDLDLNAGVMVALFGAQGMAMGNFT